MLKSALCLLIALYLTYIVVCIKCGRAIIIIIIMIIIIINIIITVIIIISLLLLSLLLLLQFSLSSLSRSSLSVIITVVITVVLLSLLSLLLLLYFIIIFIIIVVENAQKLWPSATTQWCIYAYICAYIHQNLYIYIHMVRGINLLWPSDYKCQQTPPSTLAQVMACCLMAPSLYLNKRLIIRGLVAWWQSTRNALDISPSYEFANIYFNIIVPHPRG